MPESALWSLAAEGNTRNAQEKNDWIVSQSAMKGKIRNVPSGKTNFPDHSNGRCSDFMIHNRDGGDDVRAFVKKHHKKLGVNLIIWNRTITRFYDKPGIPAGESRPYYGSNPHTDHNHVEFNEKRMSGADIPDNTVKDWDGKSFPGTDAFHIGKRHEAVKVLGEMLEAHGWTGYKVGPGTTFTEVDKKAVQWFQKKQGWKGSDADGYPGPETWKRLMADPAKPAKPEKKTKPAPKIPAPSGRPVGRWYTVKGESGKIPSYDKNGNQLDRTVEYPYNVFVNHWAEARPGVNIGVSTTYGYWSGHLVRGLIHTVEKGETLSSIAAHYGTTWQKIAADTPTLRDPNKLAVGQRLRVNV